MSASAKTSSRPGMTASSSASTVSAPAQSSMRDEVLADRRPTTPRGGPGRRAATCVEPPVVANSAIRLTSSPSGVVERVGERVGGIGRADTVRRPDSAARSAVAAATVVLPTPPLPVKSRIRMSAEASRLGLRDSEPFDRLLQLFERSAHDHAGGAALDQARAAGRDRSTVEVVVHSSAVVLGLEAVRSRRAGAVLRPRRDATRTRSAASRVVVLQRVAEALAERRGPRTRPRAALLGVALYDRHLLSRHAPIPDTARSRVPPRGTARAARRCESVHSRLGHSPSSSSARPSSLTAAGTSHDGRPTVRPVRAAA